MEFPLCHKLVNLAIELFNKTAIISIIDIKSALVKSLLHYNMYIIVSIIIIYNNTHPSDI